MSLALFIKISILFVVAIYIISVNLNRSKATKKTFKSEDKDTFTSYDKSPNAISDEEVLKLLKNEKYNINANRSNSNEPTLQRGEQTRRVQQ
jgi:hypothetical protein